MNKLKRYTPLYESEDHIFSKIVGSNFVSLTLNRAVGVGKLTRYVSLYESRSVFLGTVYYPNGETKEVESTRCSNLVLQSFGLCSKEELINTRDILNVLKSKGYTFLDIKGWFRDQEADTLYPQPDGSIIAPSKYKLDANYYSRFREGMTVKAFAKAFPKGKFILIVRGHSMSLIDGALWDLDEKGFNGRRVISATQVFTKQEWVRIK